MNNQSLSMNLHVRLYLAFHFAVAVCLAQGMMPSDVAAQNRTQQEANAIQQKLAAKYQGMEAMSAEFVQVTTSAFLESSERFSGTLILSGNKYRVQTGSQTIVTDGITLWIHNRAEKQVIINSYESDASSFSLTTFLGQMGKDYRFILQGTTTKNGVVYDTVSLLPSDGTSQFRSVKMEVRKTDTVVTHLEVVDLNDVQMTFDLSSIKVNPVIPADIFVLKVPTDAEIIDLRN